jgi:hypothetical protein
MPRGRPRIHPIPEPAPGTPQGDYALMLTNVRKVIEEYRTGYMANVERATALLTLVDDTDTKPPTQ